MRKIIYAINLSIDGNCDHTKMSPDEELYEHYIQLMRSADTLLYGRKTYQLMVPYWPDIAKTHSGNSKSGNEFADAFDAVGKIVVFSRTLDRVEHKKTTIARGDLREEILKLKQEPGKNILLGGVDLPSQIIALGLVDEYQLVVQPLIAGDGVKLLKGITLQQSLRLKLVEARALKSGNVALRYVKE